LLALFLASCETGLLREQTQSRATATPPDRADLQIPGLVELAPDDLPTPFVPEDPTQAEAGAEHFYQICLACHGDWGQGLTEEWRAEWGEDQNCWKSKCHASNHPPEGFELPTYIPPVLGLGSLNRFETADELFEYISITMPWWNPGSLSDEQAWEVTAFLLRERGEVLNEVSLDPSTAPVFRLHVLATPQLDHRPGAVALILALSVTTLAYSLQGRKQKEGSRSEQ
jgi:hypothetical protein